MYEQDVKLAKMLVDKIKTIRGEEGSVRENLEKAREELQRVQQIREERDTYLAILSEAADLLDSKDLVIENPDTTEQQETVDNLEFKLEELDEESQKYSRLIESLRDKAPQLFEEIKTDDPTAAPELSEEALEVAGEEATAQVEDSATEQEAEDAEPEAEPDEDAAEDAFEEGAVETVAEEEAEGHEDQADEDSASDAADEEPAEPDTLEVHVASKDYDEDTDQHSNGNGAQEIAAVDAEAESVAASADSLPAPGPAEEAEAGVVKVAVESPERTLSRFNLDHLKKKEAFTFGRGAAYIVDGDSVLDRLPYYDYSLRGVLENQTRDELARDIDVLSTELHGKFHIVYSSMYKPSIQLGEYVTLDCADGDGGKDAGDEHVRNLVSDLIAKHTCVCVITGDVALADSVRGQSIHILQLHDFFRA